MAVDQNRADGGPVFDQADGCQEIPRDFGCGLYGFKGTFAFSQDSSFSLLSRLDRDESWTGLPNFLVLGISGTPQYIGCPSGPGERAGWIAGISGTVNGLLATCFAGRTQ